MFSKTSLCLFPVFFNAKIVDERSSARNDKQVDDRGVGVLDHDDKNGGYSLKNPVQQVKLHGDYISFTSSVSNSHALSRSYLVDFLAIS